jgi:signal transduction histidine kinase
METAPSDGLEYELSLLRNELHDGACQYVAAAIALLEGYRNRSGDKFTDSSGDFNTALTFITRASVELRRLIRGLPAVHLDGENVVQAIERVISEKAAICDCKIEFRHKGDFDRLPSYWQVAILRITQECLGNACRHSQSERILVELVHDDDRISVLVQDWGIGFDVDEARTHGHGLNSILCRAESLGGTAVFNSRPGEGARVVAELPLFGGKSRPEPPPPHQQKFSRTP